MDKFQPLEDAVAKLKTVGALAAAIGVRQNVVSNWRARGAVSAESAPALERVTGIRAEVWCPTVRWSRVVDDTWPTPDGRPVIDPARPALQVPVVVGEHASAVDRRENHALADKWSRQTAVLDRRHPQG